MLPAAATAASIRLFLGCNTLTAPHVYTCFLLNHNPIFGQSFRWKRKPIWLPTAKSKLFRVPQRPVIPDDEYQEIKRLFNNYRTIVNSIRQHLRKSVAENEATLDLAVIEKAKEEDFENCFAINNEWNKNIATLREERLIEVRENRKAEILQRILLNEQEKKEMMKKALKDIERVKSESANFISRENIDEAIEEALNSCVDYNWAIDTEGNKYTDNEMAGDHQQTLKQERVQVNH